MRLARVVALVVAEPAAVAEHRSEVRALAKALKKGQADLSVDAEGELRNAGDADHPASGRGHAAYRG